MLTKPPLADLVELGIDDAPPVSESEAPPCRHPHSHVWASSVSARIIQPQATCLCGAYEWRDTGMVGDWAFDAKSQRAQREPLRGWRVHYVRH